MKQEDKEFLLWAVGITYLGLTLFIQATIGRTLIQILKILQHANATP